MTANLSDSSHAAETPSSVELRTRVLVMAYDRIGERMAGPGVRSWELAKALAKTSDVTVASMTPIGRSAEGVTTKRFTTEQELEELVAEADLIILQGLTLRHHPSIARSKALLIVDLYDPWVLENIELHASLPDGRCAELLLADADAQNELIDAGDFFICASERQRDYWLGMLTSRGRIDRAAWLSDAELRNLIDVVAYGCPAAPPATTPALKGVHPQVHSDDSVFLWSGGAWEWFDPLLAVEAFAEAARRHPNMVLYFMGLGLAGHTPEMPVAQKLHERAAELATEGVRVLFGDWVPYDDRGAYLSEATAAVIATRPSVESRFAFRSRMLDHFWAGLPTITTPGDTLADLVGSSGAGIVYPHGDRHALTEALINLHLDKHAHEQMSTNARLVADEYRWDDAAEPVRRAASEPELWLQQRELRLEHLAEAGIKPAWRQAVNPGLGARHVGFHSRGPIVDTLKHTKLYPVMRRMRRSWLGRAIWGSVPGE